MNKEMREVLQQRLEAAYNTGDMMIIQKAQNDVMIAQMDCQSKTAVRVKNMEQYFRDVKMQAKGAKLAAKIAYILGGALGSGVVMRLIEAFGK